MRILAHCTTEWPTARGPKSGLIVLIKKSFGKAYDYTTSKVAPQWGWYVIWGGLPRVKDGSRFYKTEKGAHVGFQKVVGKL